MIVEWFIDLGVMVSTFIAGLFPTDWELPDFLANFDTMINGVLSSIDGIAVWIDWQFVLGTVLVVLSVWGIALGVKIIRQIITHIPQFGGNG